jgi:protoheme ferro-lyase
MVFMNMGGPSKTDDVEDFLSRLFVSPVSTDCW